MIEGQSRWDQAFRKVFVSAVAVVVAAIAAQMIMAVFVAVLYLIRFSNIVEGMIAIPGVALSIAVGFLCFRKVYEYLKGTF